MPDYVGLKAAAAERQASNPGWTDAQILADINAATVTQPNLDTGIHDAFNLLLAYGAWPAVARAAEAAKTTASASGDVCLNLQYLVAGANGGGLTVIQTSDATKAGIFDAGLAELVTANLVPQAAATAITALRTPSTLTLKAQLGWPNGVNEEDLTAARNV